MSGAPRITLVETHAYLTQATRLMSEKEREDVIDTLAADPERGDLIPGSGGIRKLRVRLSGRGKRGGARVIYYYLDDTVPVFLLGAFAKNQKEDLSDEDRKVFRKFAQEMKARRKRK